MSSQLSPVEKNSRRSKALGSGVIRYFSTFRNTIDDVLAARGWQEVEEGEEFDIVWADREWVSCAFCLHLHHHHICSYLHLTCRCIVPSTRCIWRLGNDWTTSVTEESSVAKIWWRRIWKSDEERWKKKIGGIMTIYIYIHVQILMKHPPSNASTMGSLTGRRRRCMTLSLQHLFFRVNTRCLWRSSRKLKVFTPLSMLIIAAFLSFFLTVFHLLIV